MSNFSKILSNIETLSVNAVYCLVSDDLKKIYIAEGNVIKSLIRLMDSFKQGSKAELYNDLDKMELRILEESDNAEYRKLRVGYWMIHYKNYYHYRKHIPLTLRSKISYREYRDGYAFYIELYDKKYRRRVVGLFEKEDQAIAFLNAYYAKDEYISRIVYADNDLTKEYIKDNNRPKIYGI